MANHNPDSSDDRASTARVSDAFLMAGVAGGDAAALAQLIQRYDRLVRYTVLGASTERCRRDPQWLESVASAAWEGFVRSIARKPGDPPQSVAAYLTRVAKNQTLTALRRVPPPIETLGGDADEESLGIPAELEEPAELLARMETLEALRSCIAELDPEGQAMATQLAAITDRRWKDAAAALGLSESTLRSRWSRTLERLRRCIGRRTGESFAREHKRSD